MAYISVSSVKMTHLFIYLFICLFIYLFVCLFTYLLNYLNLFSVQPRHHEVQGNGKRAVFMD